MPVLVLKDCDSGCFGATALATKGADKYPLSDVVGWLQGLVYKRVCFRSDNERPLLELVKAAIEAMPGSRSCAQYFS